MTMELRALLLLPLCFPGLQAQSPDAKESRSEGSTLCIQCPYPDVYDWAQKGWCRMRENECEVLIDVTTPAHYPYISRNTKGNVTIENNANQRTMVVTMTNLRAEDAGTYSCFSHPGYYNQVILKTISLNVVKGLQAQSPDAKESLSEGSTLCIQCPYPEDYGQKLKGWCRMRENECEVSTIMTAPARYPRTSRNRKGNVIIEDKPLCKTMVVTMTNLRAEDSGTYSCVSRPRYYDQVILKTISLNVFKDLYKWELDSLSVQCPYSILDYTRGRKSWCRKDQSGCKALASTDGTSPRHTSKPLEGRILIHDNTQNKSLTITMKKLQAQDSSVYRCELYRGSNPIQIMEVRLSVSKRTQQYTAKESGSVSVRCTYSAPDYGSVSKVWCKEEDGKPCIILANTSWDASRYLETPLQGRVTIQDDTQNGTVTITMENLQAQDFGVYWCALYEHNQLFRMVEVTLNSSEVLGETLTDTPGTSPKNPSVDTTAPRSKIKTSILISGVLSIVFVLVLISLATVCIRQRKQLKRRGTKQEEDIYEKPENIQLDSTERIENHKDDSNDLNYATLSFKSHLASEEPLYCNVETSQAHSKDTDENVEYAIIALKQLPENDKG